MLMVKNINRFFTVEIGQYFQVTVLRLSVDCLDHGNNLTTVGITYRQ